MTYASSRGGWWEGTITNGCTNAADTHTEDTQRPYAALREVESEACSEIVSQETESWQVTPDGQ